MGYLDNAGLTRLWAACKSTFALTGHTHSVATTSADGLMASADKGKLDVFTHCAQTHRMIYRGKKLGTSFTAAQKAAIQAGTFDDIYLGDYWTINGRVWLVADFDYWCYLGAPALTSHHLVIVPQARLYDAAMFSSHSTAGGYMGSTMYTSGLNQAKTIASTDFPNSVLTHPSALTNAVTNGVPSGYAAVSSTVELMNANMVFGYGATNPVSDGTTIPATVTYDVNQLALFACRQHYRSLGNTAYWLRDVITGTGYILIGYDGSVFAANAGTPWGVRPVFAVG